MSAMWLDRRAFLRLSGAGLATLALPGCKDALAPDGTPGTLDPTDAPLRIVVLGAGMAGLVAAYELRLAGHDVRVVEARERVGGRVLTLREGLPAGLSAEAGAARIPPNHDLTLGYLAHFGLAVAPFYPRAGNMVVVADGVRRLESADAFRASRPDHVRIVGGSDRLPRAFASALGDRVSLATVVEEVRQGSAGGATVRVVGGGSLEADRVICTLPLPVLDRVAFDPPLSALKREAAAGGFAYQIATRVVVSFEERFWAEPEGLNGWGITDWPEEIWHPSWDAAGPGGILLSYVRGDRARALDALGSQERIAAVVAHWESVFPGVGTHARGGVTHSWGSDPWSRGAWAEPTAQARLRYHDALAAPEGVIHFAGEHISDEYGWMQGALASGLRAAREVHAT